MVIGNIHAAHAVQPRTKMKCICFAAHALNREVQSDWIESFGLWLEENCTDPQLRRLLVKVCQNVTTTGGFVWEPDEDIPMSLALAIDDQQLIGWHQKFSGRFATRFQMHQQAFLDRNYRDDKTHSGQQWLRGVIKFMWQYVLNQWEHRNGVLHGKDMKERRCIAREKVQEHVCQLYELRHTVLPVDAHLFSLPLSERLEKSTPTLKSWVRIVTKLSTQWGVNAMARAAQGCMPIEYYFGGDEIPDAALVSDDSDESQDEDDSDTDAGEFEWEDNSVQGS